MTTKEMLPDVWNNVRNIVQARNSTTHEPTLATRLCDLGFNAGSLHSLLEYLDNLYYTTLGGSILLSDTLFEICMRIAKEICCQRDDNYISKSEIRFVLSEILRRTSLDLIGIQRAQDEINWTFCVKLDLLGKTEQQIFDEIIEYKINHNDILDYEAVS